MDSSLYRRDFLRRTAFWGGFGLLGAGPAAAAEGWKGLTDVDAALFTGINRVEDPKNPSLLEQKHAPVIRVPERIEAGKVFPVEVWVGAVLHPMSSGHSIHHVALYAGNAPAGRVEFSHTLNEPRVTFHLALDRPATLVAREYCNLHGLWESRRTVELA